MNATLRNGLLAAVLLVSGGQAARASVLSFQYTLTDGNVLGGSLTGTLQADGNTFDVSGYNSITYNGSVLNINPTAFESYSNFNTNYNGTVDGSGVLTLNGSYENFIDYNANTGTGFDIIVNAGFGYNNGADIGAFGFSNLGDQPFVAANFVATATGATAVPEPATATLLGVALAGLAAFRRRR